MLFHSLTHPLSYTHTLSHTPSHPPLSPPFFLYFQQLPTADTHGYVLSVNTHGELLWKHPLEKGSTSSPLVDVEGTVYVGTEDASVHAFTSAGSEVRVALNVSSHLT